MRILGAGTSIEVGRHSEWHLLGLTFHADTIIATLIAAAVVIGLGCYLRARITTDVPNGVQLFFESVTNFLTNQIETSIGIRVAPFLVPLSSALLVFILVCNWIVVLPLHHSLPPPTADVNLAYPLALLVFCWRQAAGAARHGGPFKQLVHIARGHEPRLAPLWFIEEIQSVVSHALRLFGNLLAGGVVLSLFARFSPFFSWLPIAGWKLFDLAIGLVQAAIFALLTIVYFGQSMEDREHAR